MYMYVWVFAPNHGESPKSVLLCVVYTVADFENLSAQKSRKIE